MRLPQVHQCGHWHAYGQRGIWWLWKVGLSILGSLKAARSRTKNLKHQRHNIMNVATFACLALYAPVANLIFGITTLS